ncbi:MAG: hypothetical protein ABJF10_06275 [Chthoniobacter sp.]|uniref:hypothetical protein n=1 Tax=Chthoniobacter sp. TaxID=2510640 RepID=UPI0032A9E334
MRRHLVSLSHATSGNFHVFQDAHLPQCGDAFLNHIEQIVELREAIKRRGGLFIGSDFFAIRFAFQVVLFRLRCKPWFRGFQKLFKTGFWTSLQLAKQKKQSRGIIGLQKNCFNLLEPMVSKPTLRPFGGHSRWDSCQTEHFSDGSGHMLRRPF